MKCLPICFLVISLTACQKFPEINNHDDKLVINALVSTHKSFEVHISSSVPMTDTLLKYDKEWEEYAKVLVYENGSEFDSLSYSRIFSYLQYYFPIPGNFVGNKKIKPGHRYQIEVQAEGKETAFATLDIPNVVEITNIDTQRVLKNYELEYWESKEKMLCGISFNDPPDVNNYYMIKVACKYYGKNREDSNDTIVHIYENIDKKTSSDPIIEQEIKHGSANIAYLFTDNLINGDSYTFQLEVDGSVYMPSPYSIGLEYKRIVIIQLYSITEGYYNYVETLNKLYKNYKNPLVSEPTMVYSNIEGGYGVFEGAAVSEDSLVFIY